MSRTANVVVGDGLPAGAATGNICEFLGILQSCCAGSMSGDLYLLRQLYFMNELTPEICP